MEEPNPVGAHLLPKEDLVTAKADTFYASGSSAERKFLPYGAATRILLGLLNETSTEVWAWIKFSQVPDSLRGLEIVEASLDLKGAYSLGTITEPLSFTLHKGLQDWTGDSLALETVESGGYFEPTGTSGVLVSQPDTNIFSIQLDTAWVSQWMRASGDTSIKNSGVVLKPTNAHLIRGFRSFRDPDEKLRPTLTVIYKKSATDLDTAFIRTGEDRFLGRVTSTTWMNDSTTISIRNGVSYRGMLDFTNVRLQKNYAVHQAILEVELKDSTFLNSYSTNSLYAYFVSTHGTIESLVEASAENNSPGRRAYRFLVSTFVHYWGRTGGVQKIVLAGATEKNTVDIFGLHGPASPNVTARPRLIITYTEFK